MMMPLRRIVGARPWEEAAQHWTDAQILAKLKVPSARALVDLKRLALVARVVASARPALRALLQTAGAALWRAETRAAMQIAQAMLAPALDGLPPVLDDEGLRAWVAWSEDHPGKWKAMLQKLRVAIIANPDRYTNLAQVARGAEQDSQELDPDEFMCEQCGKWHTSMRSLRSHMVTAHGHRRAVRFFCTGSVCPACGVDWHTRWRCLWHMTRCTPCARAWQSGELEPFSEEAVQEADLRDRVQLTSQRRRGITDFAGPPPLRPVHPAMAALAAWTAQA